MEEETIEELKGLTAKERVEKLKELEKKKKEEIEAVEKLLYESEKEVKVEERIKENVEIPESESVDIGNLFEEESAESLEAGVKDAPAAEPDDEGVKYHAAEQDIGEDYSSKLNEDNPPPKRPDDMAPQTYKPSTGEDLADKTVTGRSVAESIKKYQGL